jgi:hypothetical protein
VFSTGHAGYNPFLDCIIYVLLLFLHEGIMRIIYLVLAVVGLVLPYTFFGSFSTQNGLDVELMLSQLFANPVSTFSIPLFLYAREKRITGGKK